MIMITQLFPELFTILLLEQKVVKVAEMQWGVMVLIPYSM